MKWNMGLVDRLVRGVLAVVVAVLYFSHQLSPVAGIVLGIFAVVFLATAAVGFCPLDLAVGISTRKRTAA